MTDPIDLHRQIAQLALGVHGGISSAPEPETVLSTVTASAVTLIPGVDHAAVTLVRRRHRRGTPEVDSVAATGETPRVFDALQHQHGDGPCFAAVWEHETIAVDDMRTEHRWPAFAAAVTHETSIRSTLSMLLYVGDLELGALNLHSDTPNAFGAPAVRDNSLILATHAAIALNSAQRHDQFRTALASRDMIGQAKGMIMERYDVDAVAAFDLLRRLSQNTNRPLAEVAAELVAHDHPPASA